MATQRLGDVGNAKLKSRIALGGTNEEEGEIPNNEKIDFAVQRKKARYNAAEMTNDKAMRRRCEDGI